jgi:hypothetical protein
VARLARRWGCSRMWRTTRSAVRAVVEGEGRSAGVAVWARHLPEIRERTVFEWHLKDLLGPLWAYPRRRVPGALAAYARTRRLSRATQALRNAGVARSDHNLATTKEAG